MNDYIIIADDDDDDLLLMETAFNEIGFPFPAKKFTDGDAVISYLEQPGNMLPRLIILDLNMPRVSGIQVLRFIKSNPALKEIPIYIITTSWRETHRFQCVELGANGYTIKYDTYSGMVKWANAIKDLVGQEKIIAG